eukprot:Ihof_evm2s537 gene=Ihof_evmTU2s537
MPSHKKPVAAFPHLSKEASQSLRQVMTVKHELWALRTQNKKVYTADEVNPLISRLFEVDSQHVDAAGSGQDPRAWKLIEAQIDKAYNIAWLLLESGMNADESLKPTMESLGSIWTGLRRLQRIGYTPDDVRKYQENLRQIDQLRVDGKFFNDEGDVAAGQAQLSSLLHHCYRLAHNLLVDTDEVDESLEATYNRLVFVKGKLEELARKSSYTSDEVVPFQDILHDIEQSKEANLFVFESKTPVGEGEQKKDGVPTGQAILSNLMDTCYEKVHELLVGVEEVDPVLMPILRKLEDIDSLLNTY